MAPNVFGCEKASDGDGQTRSLYISKITKYVFVKGAPLKFVITDKSRLVLVYEFNVLTRESSRGYFMLFEMKAI